MLTYVDCGRNADVCIRAEANIIAHFFLTHEL